MHIAEAHYSEGDNAEAGNTTRVVVMVTTNESSAAAAAGGDTGGRGSSGRNVIVVTTTSSSSCIRSRRIIGPITTRRRLLAVLTALSSLLCLFTDGVVVGTDPSSEGGGNDEGGFVSLEDFDGDYGDDEARQRHKQQQQQHQQRHLHDLQDRLHDAKLDLWARGHQGALLDEAHRFGGAPPRRRDDDGDDGALLLQLQLQQLERQVEGMEAWQRLAAPLGPIRRARRSHWQEGMRHGTMPDGGRDGVAEGPSLAALLMSTLRGGGTGDNDDTAATGTATAAAIDMETKILELGERFGQEFVHAVEQNRLDHARDCEESCEMYYCAKRRPPSSSSPQLADIVGGETSVRSYSMGAVPPEDFAAEFGFPLDLIKVTQGRPLLSREEAQDVIRTAEDGDGVHTNEFQSGKYRLGGDWLTNLPRTREWFNGRLETTFFPLLAHLFPEIVSDVSVLRAHSVSLLKYNSTHPRTDVHVDNGILAMTIAMTPQEEYTGGGTFFEHFAVANGDGNGDVVLPMDVGHGTFRPGSVRHGGHRVTAGTRYVLGAFLLLEDKVEHVRRLKNRGAALRASGDLGGAATHFEWALALNPRCTTCLKDWAEILHTQGRFEEAEVMIRRALELLEHKDSDALFTLGMLLSEQGRDEECVRAYRQSLALNQEDAELWYNLGVKLGEQRPLGGGGGGADDEEMRMYAMCTKVDPTFGGAWLNWGTALAERGELEDAEVMFLKALGCEDPPEVRPKAMVNLALVYHTRAGQALQLRHDVEAGREASLRAAAYLDTAKPLLDAAVAAEASPSSSGLAPYLAQHGVLRLGCHRNLGQIYAGTGDMAMCEAEFRTATANFPGEAQAWQMLGRALELQGKTEEMQTVVAKLKQLI